MSLSQTSVLKVYTTVIDDVIAGVRDAFLDEGVDEQVLQEMKQVWTSKLLACKAIESTPESQDQQAGGNAKNSAPAAVVAALDPNKLVAIQITLPAQPNVANSQPRVLTIQVPASALQENQLQQVLTSPIISSIMPLPPHIASTVLQQHVNAYLQNLNINAVPIQKQLDGACDDDGFMVGETPEVEASPISYKLVELSPNEPLERCRLDRQLISGLLAGQRTNRWSASAKETAAAAADTEFGQKHLRPQEMLDVVTHLELLKLKLSLFSANKSKLDGAVDTSDEEGSDISDDNIVDDDDEDLDKEEEDDMEAEGGAEEEPLNSEDDVTDEDASDLFDTDNVVVCQYDKITRSRNKWKFYLKDGIMHIGGKDYVFQKSNGDAEW
uniref:Transcription initiation factor IIA subunit 1 n=1 Tax=Anopheles quadriannulatus TaxID=34691 RepID=A0A182WRR4_ANOQN